MEANKTNQVGAYTHNLQFSVFTHGYVNRKGEAVLATHPQPNQDILWAYRYITSEGAREATEGFRQLLASGCSKDDAGRFKKLNFCLATFAGVFSYRNARNLLVRSPYMTLDIDNLSSMDEARALQLRFCQDTRVTTALCFVSPSGRGVKWIVELPVWTQGLPFREQFQAMRDYVGFTYGYDPDRSGSDVCRACFLPWDAECFINPQYLTTNTLQQS